MKPCLGLHHRAMQMGNLTHSYNNTTQQKFLQDLLYLAEDTCFVFWPSNCCKDFICKCRDFNSGLQFQRANFVLLTSQAVPPGLRGHKRLLLVYHSLSDGIASWRLQLYICIYTDAVQSIWTSANSLPQPLRAVHGL